MNLGKESEVLEFKESTSELHSAIESIASILNKHDYGEIYFGVYDNGEPKGQIVTDSTIKKISDSILRDIEPRIIPTITEISIEGKSIIKVSFSGKNKPYSAFGKFLVRVGTQNRHMTREELKKLFLDSDYSYPWEKEINNKTLDEIDDKTLKKYYSEAISCGRLEMPNYNKEELLSVLEIYKNNKLNNAAFAIFGKNANIGLKMAAFATDVKLTFTYLDSIKDNIYNLINTAVSFILQHINWDIKIERKRIETPEIPQKAIREIVVNAFAHALYNPTPEIEINIHPNMVTIFNPGTFPEDLNPSDFVERNISSIKRNPLILDILYHCKDVEKSGTGFRRMDQLCKEANVSWKSEKTAYGFYFTFFRNKLKNEEVEKIQKDNSNSLEKEVLKLIMNYDMITKEEMSKILNKSPRTIQRVTSSLSSNGKIKWVRNKNTGYWKIL